MAITPFLSSLGTRLEGVSAWRPQISIDPTFLKRIVGIAMPALLLFGGVYTAICYLRNRKIIAQLEARATCALVLKNAEKLLNEKQLLAIEFVTDEKKLIQPIKVEINQLAGCYIEAYKQLMTQANQNHQDIFSNPDLANLADTCIELAYAIGMATLAELETFTEKLAQVNNMRLTPAQVFTSKETYHLITFCWLPRLYRILRGCDHVETARKTGKPAFIFINDPSKLKEHGKLFYQASTLQAKWRLLHNDFCQRVKSRVSEEELLEVEKFGSVLSWNEEDTDLDKFSCVPKSSNQVYEVHVRGKR